MQPDASAWTLTRVWAKGTPSPKDIVIVWEGTCPGETRNGSRYEALMGKAGEGAGLSGGVEVSRDEFSARFMVRDYEDQGLKRGQSHALRLVVHPDLASGPPSGGIFITREFEGTIQL